MMSEQVSRGGLTVYNTRIPKVMDRRGHWKDAVNLTENRLFGQLRCPHPSATLLIHQIFSKASRTRSDYDASCFQSAKPSMFPSSDDLASFILRAVLM
jgi:hypothetical protein